MTHPHIRDMKNIKISQDMSENGMWNLRKEKIKFKNG